MQDKMLSSLVKQHQHNQQLRKEKQEKQKKEVTAAVTSFTHALVDHLNAGVAQAYVNQKKLDTETKILQANAAHFAKQTKQWLKLVEDFNQALKEIGDVENWARSMETDMRTISSALEFAYKAESKWRAMSYKLPYHTADLPPNLSHLSLTSASSESINQRSLYTPQLTKPPPRTRASGISADVEKTKNDT